MSEQAPNAQWIDDAAGPGLLEDFSDDQWQVFLEHTEPRTFTAGERLIEQGDVDRTLYLIRSGRLEIRVKDQNGQERVLGELPAGTVVGEQAFIDGHARAASIIGLEGGELLGIGPKRFREMRESHPELAAAFLLDLARALSHRLRRMTQAW
ncbi:MAG: cyclic nucleotide-binding domain-containing protein [Planctomycetota bacterium]